MYDYGESFTAGAIPDRTRERSVAGESDVCEISRVHICLHFSHCCGLFIYLFVPHYYYQKTFQKG